MYCGATDVPKSYAVGTGDFDHVTWESAFWVFNSVSNYTYLRYSDMIKDVQLVQSELENKFIAEVRGIDSAALALHEKSPQLARDYLTEYSARTGDAVVERWRELGKFLLYKYLDGNVKDENGNVTHPGYPKEWYEKVAAATGEQLKVHKLSGELAAEAAEKEKAKKTATSLLALLDARGIDVDDGARTKILEANGQAKLEKWLVRAATADTLEDVIDTE
jgi:hypothetical protein